MVHNKPIYFDQLIPIDEASRISGLGKSYIYELIKQGRFPAPVRIGGLSRYSLREVSAWIEQYKSKRAAR